MYNFSICCILNSCFSPLSHQLKKIYHCFSPPWTQMLALGHHSPSGDQSIKSLCSWDLEKVLRNTSRNRLLETLILNYIFILSTACVYLVNSTSASTLVPILLQTSVHAGRNYPVRTEMGIQLLRVASLKVISK